MRLQQPSPFAVRQAICKSIGGITLKDIPTASPINTGWAITPANQNIRERLLTPENRELLIQALEGDAVRIPERWINYAIQGVPSSFRTLDGIDWSRLKRYMKPVTTYLHKKSWVYRHGYRVALLNHPAQIYWICHHCHKHKLTDIGKGIYNTTSACTSAKRHLAEDKPGHRIFPPGKQPQGSVFAQLQRASVPISQAVANQINGFNNQRFRYAVIDWIVANNHPISELETPAFRRLIGIANPLAEAALWKNHRSVSQYVVRLFNWLKPRVVRELSQSLSKIHISFDGWTTRGGKRGFLGIVAHYVSPQGELRDLPIALPQLTGAHTGERLAEVTLLIFDQFGINEATLGYFTLDNAANNDTAIAAIGRKFSFNPLHQRLRCGPHTINLIGQMLLWGKDSDAYTEGAIDITVEAAFIREWREEGPLGVLLDIVNYIHTPQQYNAFEDAQREAHSEGPDRDSKLHMLYPIKPVVTRWNSYYDCFERASKLRATIGNYSAKHLEEYAKDRAYAHSLGKGDPPAPRWVQLGGLTAHDWSVITDYIDVLKPLKDGTKRLEGRGGEYNFGSIGEVIPVFEYVYNRLQDVLKGMEKARYNAHDEAPEDHLHINLSNAILKAEQYYQKLDDSPAYYAATLLHPRLKHYCEQAWAEHPEWIELSNRNFQALWAQYKGLPKPRSTRAHKIPSNIDEAIDGLIDPQYGDRDKEDEYEQWKREPIAPRGSAAHLDPIKYWVGLRDRYPNLSKLALTVLSIPASSCECERVFSELGDLLEPRRRCISPELLATLQSVRRWRRAGFGGGSGDDMDQSELTDDQINVLYELDKWVGDDDDISETWDG
jgi:hypothetical protein